MADLRSSVPPVRSGFFSSVVLLAVMSGAGAAEGDLAFFENKIRPLLVEHCHSCHSVKAGKQKGGLLLDSRAALLNGGDIGPAIVPGKPAESLLLKAVSYHDPELEMPPKERLSAAQVADLTTWIQNGAAWPQEAAPKSGTRHDEPVAIDPKVHWAWAPIRAVEPPPVQDQAWATTPIDRFILAKLEAAKLRPTPEADRRLLIRRAAERAGYPRAGLVAGLVALWPMVYWAVASPELQMTSAHYQERVHIPAVSVVGVTVGVVVVMWLVAEGVARAIGHTKP